MKKIMFALLALGMTLVSCKSSNGSAKGDNSMEQVARKPMGMWKAMEWTSSSKMEKKDAVYVVNVPADKNNVELNCSNYNSFWLSSVNERGITADNKDAFDGEFFNVKCLGNKLLVAFDTKASTERSFYVTVQAGDVFSRIKFVQKAK